MLKNKPGPYLLIIALVVSLTFIIGVRYGQKVEKTNKTISYLLSITPAKTQPFPTASSLKFETYESKDCGIKFLYPLWESIHKNVGSQEAELTDRKDNYIYFTCEKNSSPEATLDKNLAQLKLKNPFNYKTIYVTVSKNLLPLFETSLKYSR
jgi:hypothetical protein